MRDFLILILLLWSTGLQANAQTTFSDVAPQVGILDPWRKGDSCGPGVASGSAWGDYDNDGDVDLFVTNDGGSNLLYRNDGDLNSDGLPDFTDVADSAGVSTPASYCHSAVFIDYDNDGDQDLFVTRWGGNDLYRNSLVETGVPLFENVTGSSGINSFSRCITSAWGDYDRDGYLDLYLSNYRYCVGTDISMDFLYRNRGDGTFEDATTLLCPDGVTACPEVNGLCFTAVWVDYDNDGDPDLYVANDYISDHKWPNVLWRNDGPGGPLGWIFTNVSDLSEANLAINSMGLGLGDYDNDGFLDFALSNIGPNKLLKNQGDGTFDEVSSVAGVERAITPGGATSITWGTVFFDYDNDRWLDLYYVAGNITGAPVAQPNAFFRNNGDGTFEDISAGSGLDDPLRGRSASIADFDNDGFVDVFVGNLNRPDIGSTAPYLLFHNRSRLSGNNNNWLAVTVEGTYSNRDGIGTRLSVTTGDGTTQIREITTGPTYGGGDHRAAFFGLGDATTCDLVVRWPTGVVDSVGPVAANQTIHLVETSPPSQSIEFRINSGGNDYTTGEGEPFVADKAYALGSYGYIGGRSRTFTNDISGTTDDALYQSVRLQNGTFSYALDGMITGDYEITLHFMEPAVGVAGARLIDVLVEGAIALDDFDIYASAGARYTAVTRMLVTTVSDGQLNLSFVSVSDKPPLVCAIEVSLLPDSTSGLARNGESGPTPDFGSLQKIAGFQLGANHPNPFNPSTVIRYTLSVDTWVRLSVHNVLGQEIAILADEFQRAGEKSATWHGTNMAGAGVASGVYFYRLMTGNFAATRKMVLAR